MSAVNEERLSRRKLEVRFPREAIAACLHVAGVDPSAVDLVAASTTDVAKTVERVAPWTKERHYLVRRRKATAGPFSQLTKVAKVRITEWGTNGATRALSQRMLRGALRGSGLEQATFRLFDHHECHAAAAAWSSGMDPCAVLTIDGLGDGVSTTISVARAGALERVTASPARHSLGVFFEHVTNLLNMRELEDEGKVMALAEFAAPVADDENPLLRLVTVAEGRVQTALPGHALMRRLRTLHWRYPNEQFAYMAQRTVEHACTRLAQDAVRLTGVPRLAVAGGVASNIKATRRMRLLPDVEALYVFPHMGDGGLAVGAAVAAAASAGEARSGGLDDLALGLEFSDDEIQAALRDAGVRAQRVSRVEAAAADLIAGEKVVLWFQGAMEYGPRALGHRSVLARADRPLLRDRLNLVLKRRVWYQPFCPSVLESDAARALSDWDVPTNRPMTMAYLVSLPFRGAFSGVIGQDGSCRPHIVPDAAPGRFAELLRLVKQKVGVGVVLNTSYNIHGEPLVCGPGEAIDVFKRSGADALAIGPFLALAGRSPGA